jgi:hypothetical protein
MKEAQSGDNLGEAGVVARSLHCPTTKQDRFAHRSNQPAHNPHVP